MLDLYTYCSTMNACKTQTKVTKDLESKKEFYFIQAK